MFRNEFFGAYYFETEYFQQDLPDEVVVTPRTDLTAGEIFHMKRTRPSRHAVQYGRRLREPL